ncbi:hypothetical protein PM082_017935 [Marasmius tenuissimus]|nr:hypothetical protein PM082_017935 [Marasmius tenuissimus]
MLNPASAVETFVLRDYRPDGEADGINANVFGYNPPSPALGEWMDTTTASFSA